MTEHQTGGIVLGDQKYIVGERGCEYGFPIYPGQIIVPVTLTLIRQTEGVFDFGDDEEEQEKTDDDS